MIRRRFRAWPRSPQAGGAAILPGTRQRTGNALDNYLEGSRATPSDPTIPANVIDGGPGADTMVGFSGNDVFVVYGLCAMAAILGMEIARTFYEQAGWIIGITLLINADAGIDGGEVVVVAL